LTKVKWKKLESLYYRISGLFKDKPDERAANEAGCLGPIEVANFLCDDVAGHPERLSLVLEACERVERRIEQEKDLTCSEISEALAEEIEPQLKARPTRKRPCAKCGLKRPPSGHDPCIENLPGVGQACCGHGIEEGYVVFMNGIVLHGGFEIESMAEMEKRLDREVRQRLPYFIWGGSAKTRAT
jgi:hypothetical protein